MIREFYTDLIKYLPSKVIPGLFGIISITLFTRLFDPDEYGQYILIMSTISMLSILGSDWISTSVIRFNPKYRNGNNDDVFIATVFGTTLVSASFLSLVFVIVILLLHPFTDIPLLVLMPVCVFILFMTVFFAVMLKILQSGRKVNQYSFMFLWRQVVCLLVGFGIVYYTNSGVRGMLVGIMIGLFLVSYPLFRMTFVKLYSSGMSRPLRNTIITYGFPLAATNVFAWVLSLSDRYVIRYFRGDLEVGLYSISYSIADRTIQLIVSLIILASAPIAMDIWEKGDAEKTREFITKLTKTYLIICVPAAVGLSLLSRDLVKFLATEEYFEGFRVMPYVALSVFLFGLQRNFQLGLLFFEKTRSIMLILVITGTLNIVLNILAVPSYGYLAAGVTTLISYLAFATLIILESRKYFVWNFPFASLKNVLLGTTVMSLCVLAVLALGIDHAGAKIVVSIISGMIVYSLMLILLKEIHFKSLKRMLVRGDPV